MIIIEGTSFEKSGGYTAYLKASGTSDKEKTIIKELFDYFISLYLRERDSIKFGLKKVWLKKEEQNLLEHHLNQIDELFKKAEKQNTNRSTKNFISMKKVFFWGYCDYRDLIKEALKN